MAWLGVRSGALNLLVPVGEVSEVLHLANCTPVPLTLPWFRGLNNVRGTLYSVIDLSALLGYAPVQLTADSRVLLLSAARIRNTALLVNRLAGMVADDGLTEIDRGDAPNTAAATGPAAAALASAWADPDQLRWRALDLAALIALPEFLDVAATPALGAFV
jgi:twitching motility protein PilI